MSLRLVGALLPLAVVGCTSMLGIDGNYYVATDGVGTGGAPGGGGSESGGVAESGGTPAAGGQASGGVGESGGASSGGASDGGTGGGGTAGSGGGGSGGDTSCDSDASSCASGEKCCPIPQPTGMMSKSCVAPIPIVGCASATCDPCPAAPSSDAIAVCNAQGACDFECNGGFKRVGNGCQPNSSTGSGGAGGTTSTCTAANCHSSCGLIGPLPCCRNNGTCGCTWAPGAVCY